MPGRPGPVVLARAHDPRFYARRMQLRSLLRWVALVLSAGFLLLALLSFVTRWSEVESAILTFSFVAVLFALVAVVLRSPESAVARRSGRRGAGG